MEVKLSNGKTMLVDAQDYDFVNHWKWRENCHGYADRNQYISHENGKRKQKMIVLHRLLMDAPTGMEVDHINGDKLDNRRDNLRLCTKQQNSKNRKSYSNSSSRHRGVYWEKKSQCWGVKLGRKTLGRFGVEEDAAEFYNQAARAAYGEFARLNVL